MTSGSADARLEGEAEPVDAGVVRLSDGRSLGWTAWGAPGGRIVVEQPHVGVSGRRAFDEDVAVIADAGIRLIIVARAGLGESSPKNDRTVQTDSEDMVGLADALGLDRLHLLGHCGGSGPALAFAARWPDRVASLALVSPAAPLNGPGADSYLIPRLNSMRASLRFRPLARFVAWGQRRAYWRDPEKALEEGWKLLPAVDRVFVEGLRRRLTRLEADEYFGSAATYLGEWGAVQGPWNIDWSAIRCPMVIDHGELDTTWPVGMGRWLASVLPTAELHVDPARGHYLAPPELVALLDRLHSKAAHDTSGG